MVEFRLEGLISGPHVQKLNRNSIFLFVNGRLIRDKLLLHAISSAFHNLMPPGCYPFALLFLTCDPGEVDVNVHPAKTEVRFQPWFVCSRFCSRCHSRDAYGAAARVGDADFAGITRVNEIPGFPSREQFYRFKRRAHFRFRNSAACWILCRRRIARPRLELPPQATTDLPEIRIPVPPPNKVR